MRGLFQTARLIAVLAALAVAASLTILILLVAQPECEKQNTVETCQRAQMVAPVGDYMEQRQCVTVEFCAAEDEESAP